MDHGRRGAREHLFPCRNPQSREARLVRGKSIWSVPGPVIPGS